MKILTRKKTPAFGLCFVILLLPADCASDVTLVHHFELSSCPGESFSLPTSVDQAPYKLSGVGGFQKAEHYRLCPGFTPYHLRENNKDRLWYHVRLNRSESCSLDVGYMYAGERSETVEERHRPWVEAVARLVTQGSDAQLRVPAARVQRFDSYEAVKEWCARGTDQAERKCDDSYLAEALAAHSPLATGASAAWVP